MTKEKLLAIRADALKREQATDADLIDLAAAAIVAACDLTTRHEQYIAGIRTADASAHLGQVVNVLDYFATELSLAAERRATDAPELSHQLTEAQKAVAITTENAERALFGTNGVRAVYTRQDERRAMCERADAALRDGEVMAFL
jgi:hypothetical protein